VTLKIADFSSENLSYQLFDVTGKQIANEKIINSETSISLENLNTAIYLLNIIDNKTTIKTFKIIKN
jgi:Secretion system C-terminal sorting domain